jgi:hypothetical protein
LGSEDAGSDKILESFGLVISVVCPGMLTLWALSVAAPSVMSLLPGAQAPGAFFFVLLAGIGVGLILGGCRQLLFEELMFKRKWVALPPDNFVEASRCGPGADNAYRDLRANYYPYYQFYSHMTIAAVVVLGCWLVHSHPPLRVAAAGLALWVGVEFVFFRNAVHSLRRYMTRRNNLLTGASAASSEVRQ